VKGSCEHGDELPGSIKFWEIIEELSDWRFLKKGSATWS
jgi:predicted deacylase